MEIKNNKLFVQEGNYIPDVEFDINTISQLSFSYIKAKQNTDLLVIQALLPYVQSSVLDDSDSIYGFSYLTI